MDPRQLWNRNTVLAEAFCLSDEHVRSAQSALDETQAHRSRLLAAFAVTVGSDSAVADLLGLSEREVRVARRTVGKDDARRMADDVLATASPVPGPEGGASATAEAKTAPAPPAAPASAAPQPPVAPPAPAHTLHHQPQPQSQPQQQHQSPQQPQLHPQQSYAQQQPVPYYESQMPGGTAHDASMTPMASMSSMSPMASPSLGSMTSVTSTAEIPVVRETAWTSAMDLVLIDSWQSGIDLRVLADEFGLDLARLVTRVQQLSAEGRLTSPQPAAGAEDRSGRHRRDAGGAASGMAGTAGGSYAAGSYGSGSYGSGSYAPGSYGSGSYAAGSYGSGSYGSGSYGSGGSYGSYDPYGSTYGTYGTYGSYGTYGNGATPSGWEAPSTIPEEMVASYLPQQHSSWPNYMAGSTTH